MTDIDDLADLNAALVAGRERASSARAKLELRHLASRGTPGHGAAQGGEKPRQEEKGK